MEEFILAGLLFHVGAAASLAIVSAATGIVDAHRRKAASARAAVNTAAVIALPSTRPARAAQREAGSQSKAA